MTILRADTYTSEGNIRMIYGVHHLEVHDYVLSWFQQLTFDPVGCIHPAEINGAYSWCVEPSRYNLHEIYISSGARSLWITREQFNEVILGVRPGPALAVVDFETDWDVL